jgi:hypothetical protein
LILAIGREYFVKREIWSVTAGTFRQTKGPQFERPPTLGRKWPYTPDIYATKHGHTRVVEIETNSNRGEKKRKTFWRHVGQKNNCVFYWRIVDAEGRRRKSRGNYPGDVL